LFGVGDMLRKVSIAFGLVVALAFSMTATAQDAKVQKAEAVTVTESLHFLSYVPGPAKVEDTRNADGKWPLIIFLHGSGERGSNLDMVKVHGPPKIVEGKPLPFIVLSPQCPSGRRWVVEHLATLLDDAIKRYPVDPKRVYLTGLSMGGFGTFDFAAAYPKRLAAIVPICGRGEASSAERFKDVPCWVFHGALDEAVPLIDSAKMVAALKKAGGSPKFTIYPEAAHDCWTETYNNPELYKWLLQQKLPD
jgi:predicted peptidase